ncbi:MAG TPA: L-threonylcarbamoyladenylate synthase [bacterium]|jgi:L-threonylcarbamoyladenylate synthase|nr:threonylcarbamoyl-AMP synthase [bacterium]MDX9804582.1 L-threonylcarbamoyladenylate synthase [bacterium]HNZ53567.1 L-threonylcarbamoyladenylate synthase [bacterium]HOG42657.1 L-threonylcarbamoyladenylate synthase [bacterium]HPY14104.1 L-threonylcarbamoyladenylate synthase [bacterium]
MEILSIEEAAWKIRNGLVVAYPTETVYGLGSIIFEKEPVMRIKQIKKIPENKPLSVLVSNNKPDMIFELIDSFLPVAQRLAKFFWPGPLTILHECRADLPSFITGNTGFVGIRCSPFAFVNSFIDLVGHPVVSTSANPTGEKPAQNYMDVFSYFNNLIDGVLICDDSISFEQKNIVFNVPSTIVKVDQHNFEIIREGAIKRDDIIRKIL